MKFRRLENTVHFHKRAIISTQDQIFKLVTSRKQMLLSTVDSILMWTYIDLTLNFSSSTLLCRSIRTNLVHCKKEYLTVGEEQNSSWKRLLGVQPFIESQTRDISLNLYNLEKINVCERKKYCEFVIKQVLKVWRHKISSSFKMQTMSV